MDNPPTDALTTTPSAPLPAVSRPPPDFAAPTSPARPPAAAPPGGQAQPRERTPLREEFTIFIGKKSTMSYVLAVVTQFNAGAPHVRIKARGKLISQAVDVAEIVRHRFLPDAKVGPISIQTEELENEDGSKSKVSSIEIKLLR